MSLGQLRRRKRCIHYTRDHIVDEGARGLQTLYREAGSVLTVVEREGVVRIHKQDRTAVFLGARSVEEFAQGSLPRAMPSRRGCWDALSIRPSHNAAFYPGSIQDLQKALGDP